MEEDIDIYRQMKTKGLLSKNLTETAAEGHTSAKTRDKVGM